MSGFYRVEIKVVTKNSIRPNGGIGTNSALKASAYISGEKIENNPLKTAAYISGSEMRNDQEVIADYTNKKGVVFSEVVLPKEAPIRLQDPEVLWSEVEKLESKRKDSVLFREWISSFEKHLTMEEKLKVAREYAESLASEGMAVQYAVHLGHDGNNNDHAHFMATVRGFENGEWKKRRIQPQEFLLDSEGNRIPVIDKSTGEQMRNKDGSRRWKKTKVVYEDGFNELHAGNVERWRKLFADLENQYLPAEFQVTPDSYATQGIDKIPGAHLGKAASNMQRKLVEQVNGLPREKRSEYLERILKQVQSDYRRVYYENSRALSNERKMMVPESAEHKNLRVEVSRELHRNSKYRPQKQYISNFLGRGHLQVEHALTEMVSFYRSLQSNPDNDDYATAEVYLKAADLAIQAENHLLITFTAGLTRSTENFIVQSEYEMKKVLLQQLGKEIRETEREISLLGRIQEPDKNETDRIEQQIAGYRKQIGDIRAGSVIDTAERISEHARAIRESKERLAELGRRSAETAGKLSKLRSRKITNQSKKSITR